MLKKWMMPNGLWVIANEMPHTSLVAASLHIKGGSRRDSERAQGIAHFLEHVFFRGTEKYPDRETLNSLVEADGGYWNAMTSHERICAFTSVFTSSIEKAFDAISQMAFHPLFREEDINVERGAVIEEINISLDDPENCVHRLYEKLAWGDHPAGREILGPREHVEAIGRPDFLEYFNANFYPGNMVLSVAGGVEAKEIFELAFKYFDGGARSPRVEFSGEISPSAERVSFLEKDNAQVNLVLGSKALRWLANTKDMGRMTGALLLSKILSSSTRLFKKVRDEKGLVYTIYSSVSAFSDGGCFYTYMGSELGHAQTALQITLDEYDNVRRNGVTEEELKRAKLAIKRAYAERNEKSTSMALSNGGSELLTGESLDAVAEYNKYIEPVTLDDISAAAQDLLNKEDLYLAVVGKLGEKRKEFEDILLS